MKRCLDVTGTDPVQKQTSPAPASTKMLPKDTEELGPGPSSKNFVPCSSKTEAGATMAPTTLLELQNVRTGGDLRGNQIKSAPVTDEEVQAQGSQVQWYR